MSEHTEIQWADSTWNPATGCTKVSAACAHCYIERTPPFRIAGRKFVKGNIPVELHPERLDVPLRWRKPRRVFVCSLADLFHDDIPDRFIAEVFGRMALAHQHTFQVLTKRPERMQRLLTNPMWWACVEGSAQRVHEERTGEDVSYSMAVHGPLPNVWLGVSIENQRHAWRAGYLRETPAAVRFISAEPLLGTLFNDDRGRSVVGPAPQELKLGVVGREPLVLDGIDWVIVGGESGPKSRSTSLWWIREVIDECRANGVAVFVKQLGARPVGGMDVGTKFFLPLKDKKGGDPREWPDDIRIREFPRVLAVA